MFKFRKEHIAAFEAQAAALFTARVIAHVKAVWPVETAELGEPGLAEWVGSAVKRATALGLSAEYDVARFVDLTFLLAKEFENNPLGGWTRVIMADRNLTPTGKIDKLYEQMEQQFLLIEKRNLGRP